MKTTMEKKFTPGEKIIARGKEAIIIKCYEHHVLVQFPNYRESVFYYEIEPINAEAEVLTLDDKMII